MVYNSPSPVSALDKVITSLIDRQVPSKIIRQKVNNKVLFNKNCVNAFHNKQNAYCLWSQNRSDLLCADNLTQSFYDAEISEYKINILNFLNSIISK